jgi:hypothetical protein
MAHGVLPFLPHGGKDRLPEKSLLRIYSCGFPEIFF